MPVPYLKKLHDQTGLPMSKLETMWDECKAAATKADKDKKHYWGFVVYLLKQKLGIKEALSFREFVDIENEVVHGDHAYIPPMVEPAQEEPEVLPPPVIEPEIAIMAELPPEPPAAEQVPIETASPVAACTPRNLVSMLFSARDRAHQLHLRTKSFSKHVALGEFYERLIELADELAETVQGKYGIMEPVNGDVASMTSIPSQASGEGSLVDEEIRLMMEALSQWLDNVAHSCVPAEDTFIHNLIDEVQALTYRTKYKLDNLA